MSVSGVSRTDHEAPPQPEQPQQQEALFKGTPQVRQWMPRAVNSIGMGSSQVGVNLSINPELWFDDFDLLKTRPNQSDFPFTGEWEDEDDGLGDLLGWKPSKPTHDADKYNDALAQYKQRVQEEKQRIYQQWMTTKPEYDRLMDFVLTHELGHSQRNITDPNYEFRLKKGFTPYQRGGQEWDANFYALRSAYDQLSPEQRKTMTYYQFVKQTLPQKLYNRYMINPAWKNALMNRMVREKMVLGR